MQRILFLASSSSQLKPVLMQALKIKSFFVIIKE